MGKRTLELTVENRDGLHARPAGALARYMTGLPDHVVVTLTRDRDGTAADAKSIFGLLTLAAAGGETLLVEVKSTDGELDDALVEEIFEKTRAAVGSTTKGETKH